MKQAVLATQIKLFFWTRFLRFHLHPNYNEVASAKQGFSTICVIDLTLRLMFANYV
jgi:hypothetical protein